MRLMITGGCGFIGSHFVRAAIREGIAREIMVVDALTYAGHLTTIEDCRSEIRFERARIEDRSTMTKLFDDFVPNAVVNFAAESHNDRSLVSADAFIQTNVTGVHSLLECARRHPIERFVHVSTDEVYGEIAEGEFTEESPLRPNTPYSASKAGGDHFARAAWKAYGMPVCVTRGGNTYGPYQYPEKLIPFFLTRLIQARKVPLYGDGSQIRQWIHVEDHVSGILKVLRHGADGEIYNIGDRHERSNRQITDALIASTHRSEAFIHPIPDPRQGAHDVRYALATNKLRDLGWVPEVSFDEGLQATAQWYLEHEKWWRPLVEDSGYVEFVKRYYGPGLGSEL